MSAANLIDLTALTSLPAKVAQLEQRIAELTARLDGNRDPNALLTVIEAAAELHISEQAVYKRIRRGVLKAERVGKSIRIRRRALTDGGAE